MALSPEARAWLADLKAECDQKGISVAYAIPWFYGSEADRPAMVEAHRRFLADVGRIVLILPDPSMGVNTRRDDYADSLVHPRARPPDVGPTTWPGSSRTGTRVPCCAKLPGHRPDCRLINALSRVARSSHTAPRT